MSLRSAQTGQAVMEFMVAALFVLAPAIYLAVHLGKVGDLQHRAYEGARYSAWEKAKTSKSDTAIQNEINKRIFYQDYKKVNSVTDRTGNNTTAELESLYTHRADDGTREAFVMLKNGTFNNLVSNTGSPGGAYDTRADLVRGVGGLLSFDLSSSGMVTSTIEMTTSKSKYLDGLSIHPHAWNTMVLEDWRKVTSAEVKAAINDSLAANALPVNPIMDQLKTIGSMLEMPEWAEFDWGHVEPNVTGCTRLVGGAGNEKAC